MYTFKFKQVSKRAKIAQFVDKMLSYNTFWKLEFNRYTVVYLLSKIKLGVHVQRMLEMSMFLYTGRNLKENFGKKNRSKFDGLFSDNNFTS